MNFIVSISELNAQIVQKLSSGAQVGIVHLYFHACNLHDASMCFSKIESRLNVYKTAFCMVLIYNRIINRTFD